MQSGSKPIYQNVSASLLALMLFESTVHGQETINSFKDCSTCPEMVWLPTGKFIMGEPEAESQARRVGWGGPPIEVRIKMQFAMARTEITRDQYESFVNETKKETTAQCKTILPSAQSISAPPTWRDPLWPSGEKQAGNEPVVCIGYEDTQAYIIWLNNKAKGRHRYALPSESQFEYAARAGTTSSLPWPGELAQACAYANLADNRFKTSGSSLPSVNCDDGFAYTAPVGSYPANAFGLHDMLGNVWEWVADCGSQQDLSAYPRDGSALVQITQACTSRATRGGSFVSNDWWMRVSARGGAHDAATTFNPALGFRVIATAQ